MKIHRVFIFLFFAFIAIAAFAEDQSIDKIAQSHSWRSIIQATEKSLFLRQWQSRSDSKNFFITEDRKTKLSTELQKSIELVKVDTQSQTLDDKSFSCRFPVRSQFILKHFFNNTVLNDSGCAGLQNWRTRVSAKSVTLIFSSYYLGNPSSTFGHTLLRLNSSGENKTIPRELLSYGINYGANPWTTSPLPYTIGGLSGWFTGTFAAIPYYYKVREYNDYESRDLWEYELNLTPEETATLVDLLWEQKDNFFDYYFLTENCGFYIAALIQAAVPQHDLVSALRKWVIPSDTLSVFDQAGLIKSSKLRPSILNQFLERLKKLDTQQEKTLSELYELTSKTLPQDKQFPWPESFAQLSSSDQAKVLDATLDYYDYKHGSDLLDKKSKENEIKDQLLVQRSVLPVAEKLDISSEKANNPIYQHGSFRYQLTQQVQVSSTTAAAVSTNTNLEKYPQASIVGMRFAFHDLEDPLPGQPQNAHVEVGNFKFIHFHEATESQKLQIQEVKFAQIASLPSWNRWTKQWSSDTAFGAFRMQNSLCSNCLTGQLRYAKGLTHEWIAAVGRFSLSGLLQARYIYADMDLDARTGWNYFSLGPRFIFEYDINSNWQSRLEAQTEPLSTSENKIWDVQSVLRKNFDNQFALELGYNRNEINEYAQISFYLFSY